MSVRQHPEVGPPELREVADHIFAYIQPDGTWWINNTGLLLGPTGAVSIDSCATEARTRAYRAAIAERTALPVRTLVNTHHHGDHTHGNYLFPEATIVAHQATRTELLAAGVWRNPPFWTPFELGQVVLEPPSLTYTEGVTLWLGDTECQVRHVGRPAHTSNDSIVWIPEHRVLFAGDLLFSGGTPFVLMGSVAGSLQVLTEVLAPLDPQVIVAGHGEVAGPEVIEQVRGYLQFVWDLALRGRQAGLSPLELARECDLGPYADLRDSERLVGNLHRAYADLGEAPLGAPLDAAVALADMVAFNGGQPLTCLA